MQQLNGTSKDILAENIEKLKELFPEVFSEGKIDFKKLEEELGTFTCNDAERYNFTWAGKSEAKKIAQTPSTGTLRPCREESKKWDTTQNLYIEGDNLEVLKLLQKSYYKQVKMIYIDPPYNTGKDFVYKDNFHDNIKNYLEITGQVDSEGNKLSTNSDTNGRYHSDWLSMMYPRLKLARNLLKDDGVIFISIDDNEVANLRKVCDEIFGEDNFVAEISVASNSSKNNAKLFSISHEYMLCYAKSKICINEEWKVKKNNVDEYYSRAMQLVKRGLTEEEIHNELLELVKYPRFYDLDHYTFADENGIYQTDNPGGVSNGNMITEIYHPVTNKKCTKPNGGWRYKDEEIQRMLNEGLFSFGEDETGIPRPKRYLKDYMSQLPKSTMFFDSQSSTKWLKSNKIPFDFAKSIELIKHILSIFPNDVVLDFFSGSATTAHAVMQLNSEDEGNRKFIMVQLPETTDNKEYSTICEIGKERIRRAGEKIIAENCNKDLSNLDIGFKVLKLDSSNIKAWDSNFKNVEGSLLDAVENIKSDRSSEDLLYEILLKYGLDLTLPIEEKEMNDKKVFIIGYGALVACLDNDITIPTVEAIAKLKEHYQSEIMRVVFKDASFKDAVVKTNAYQILKQFGIDEVVSV
ncbi:MULTISPECIES: site-specific DNA-methyltransferase [unclassified Sulfurospirillum]|uniref:site-specific DNA-methyltransferase n=1 Tax=unclassified Sulfurospirillum TaxID=2618290 RepID=UPI0005019D35|nr:MULTISPECIES: site-specific DNA-methyltransferase [unclassified Sulfurospirillum]KFL34927.1 hypothetical protein JU57_02860 [Sulfurospirillum sp. SCADC]